MPSPKIARHPNPLLLCSCSPGTFQPPGASPLLRHGFPQVLCLSSPQSSPTAGCISPHTNRTHLPHSRAPHHRGCPISHAPLLVACPTPNIPRPLPLTPLLRGGCAPSPSTAYCIFGKTCSLVALRRYEAHLRTATPGKARFAAGTALPCRRSWLPARVQRPPPPSGHPMLHDCLCRARLLPHNRHVTLSCATAQVTRKGLRKGRHPLLPILEPPCSRDLAQHLPPRHEGFYFKGAPDTTSSWRCQHRKEGLSPATASCSQRCSPELTRALPQERLLGKHREI